MPSITTNDPETLLLGALAETLSDERRAIRFLDMTGIDAGSLRARAADPETLGALHRADSAKWAEVIRKGGIKAD